MIQIKTKNKNGKTYFPCRIKNYNKYRNKLANVLQGNPNLYFEGVKEIPSGLYGILINGSDILELSRISIFYSLRDINFFFYKKQEREQLGIE